jgi:hypothetical protein
MSSKPKSIIHQVVRLERKIVRTISSKKSGPKRALGRLSSALFSPERSAKNESSVKEDFPSLDLSETIFNDDEDQSLATLESAFDVASDRQCRSIDQHQFITDCLFDSNDNLFIVHFYLEDCPISAALDREIEEIVASGHQSTCKFLRIGASRALCVSAKLRIRTDKPVVVAMKNGCIVDKISDFNSRYGGALSQSVSTKETVSL